MPIVLDIATFADAQEIYDLQIKAFKALLEKYEDYDFSPGAEKLERTIQRLRQPATDYYFISLKTGRVEHIMNGMDLVFYAKWTMRTTSK